MRKKLICALLAALLVFAPGLAVTSAAQHEHTAQAPSSQSKSGMMHMVHDDASYVEMMLMHHDGGIEMAKTEIDKGERQDVKDLASKILAGQEADKKALQEFQARLTSASGAQTGRQTAAASGGGMHGMSGMSGGMHDMGNMSDMDKQHHDDMEKLKSASGADADRLFLSTMAQHHQMAVDMSKQAKPNLKDSRVRAFADKTIESQTREIADLKKLRSQKPAR